MEKENQAGFDTRIEDVNRIYELGFITWEELGEAHQAILLQDISDELDRMVKRNLCHPSHFPLDK